MYMGNRLESTFIWRRYPLDLLRSTSTEDFARLTLKIVSRHRHLVLPNMPGPQFKIYNVTLRRKTLSYLWRLRRQYKHHINLRLVYHRNSSLRINHTNSRVLESLDGWWSLELFIYAWMFLWCWLVFHYPSRDICSNCTICLNTWRNATTVSLYSIQVIKLLISKSLNVKIGPQASLTMSLVMIFYHQTCLIHMS